MKDFFNPNVKGGLRWIHIHLGLVLAILGTVFMVAANAPRPQSFPSRPQNVVVVPPVHFVPHATLRFVKHTSFCEAYPKRCPEPDHPSTSAMTRISSQAGWYVSPFYTYDTALNIAPIVNAAGDYYNIWPVYLLAVVFAESGGNQYAHRWGCGYGVHCNDVSFGLVQVTTNTLTGYYNGCGLNDYCAANYLYNPTVSIWLGARILHDYRNETGVSYLALWECYNAGPGSCQSPYYSAFLDAYYRATGYSTNAGVIASPTARPTPRPIIHYSFPAGHWKQWTHRHHKHPIIHALHHHLVWAATVWWAHQGQTYCGGITHKEQYFSAGKNGKYGFLIDQFQGCTLVLWPHQGWTKLIKHAWKR